MKPIRHVLVITLGPVQEFIEQARRTRDLWYGSHLLSEISKAAARALRPFADDGEPRVIFPAIDDEDDWNACDEPVRDDGTLPLNVSNHLLAVLKPSADPHTAAVAARRAAQERLAGASSRVRAKLVDDHVVAGGIERVWDEQVDTHLEFAAAWHPFDDDSGYADARREAEAALGGRRGLREFGPWRESRAGAPKSSLDGARESVLAEPDPRDERQAAARLRLRLSRGEQLDAIGLVKRAGGSPEQFVPLANIALAAWIEEAARRVPRELADLRAACKTAGVSRVHRPELQWVFPFDAHVFLRARWGALFEELRQPAKAGEAWGEQHVAPILKAMPPPFPYVACLVADGDRMGSTLDAATTPARHRELSQALARFASAARQIVEGARSAGRRGVLVYSGGDDVLAFVALSDALRCAQALRDAFEGCLAGAAGDGPQPTLSVGLGVGHLMDEMGHLLRLGRRAEKAAKSEAGTPEARDALAVLVDKRAGSDACWRGRWGTRPVERLERDVELLRARRLSTGKLHEVRELLRRLPASAEVASEDAIARASWAALLRDDVRRTLRRTEGHGEERLTDAQLDLEFGLELAGGEYAATHAAVAQWIERLRVARALAAAEIEAQVALGVPA